MTCKIEGKATVHANSEKLMVTMKIGFNQKNERLLHLLNQLSHTGGDPKGELFKEFLKVFTKALYDAKAYAEQADKIGVLMSATSIHLLARKRKRQLVMESQFKKKTKRKLGLKKKMLSEKWKSKIGYEDWPQLKNKKDYERKQRNYMTKNRRN
jgi:hypothetical protein